MPDNRKGFASALHIRGLRQRWMFSAVLPILLLLVLAVALFSVGVQEYYYNAMRSGLESRARIAAETFTGYGVKSYSEYYRLASYSAETFEEKDTIELQFINTNGRVQVSSYGLTAGTLPGTSDVDNAIGGKMASFQGRDPQTGENILAVSYPLFFNSRVVGVLRYVTSLREAQHRVLVESLLASAAALVCMALIAASNAIFINNVVQPVAVVSDAARRISGGSYGIMIENHYRDELGELVDNINDMSLKISQSEKMQTEFISSVSHELRTPLALMQAQLELFSAEHADVTPETAAFLSLLQEQTERMAQMTKILLEMSELRTVPCDDRVELAPMIEEIFTDLAPLAESKCIALEADGGAVLTGSDPLLYRLLFNLTENAIRYGRPDGAVRIAVSEADGNVQIRVRDHGPGIPEAYRESVFQPFFRVDKSRSRAHGGVGLGLSLVWEIAALHGGTVQIERSGADGTVMLVTLPRDGKEA